MATYNAKDLDDLAETIAGKSNVIDKALALTINKTATEAIRLSINEITSEVNLQPNYIKKHIKTTSRAKFDKLRAKVTATERGTLLTRYPHFRTQDGVRVSINRGTSYSKIKGARILKSLRGSGASGIALRNKDAVEFFKQALSKGKRTPQKSRKLQRIIRKARTRPFGWTVLHSRSVNQLFTSVREDIQPDLTNFMAKEFLDDFNRLNK